MLYHQTIQQHRPIGSKENLLKVLNIFGHDGHAGYVTGIIWANLHSQESLHMIHMRLTLTGTIVSENMFEECGRRRTTEACLSYKLANKADAHPTVFSVGKNLLNM